MSDYQLEEYLYENIPISKALGLKVISATPQEVVVGGALQPNINHKYCVFGGSLHSIATFACWGLAYINLLEYRPIEIVITHSSVDYIAPVTTDFKVTCKRPADSEWNRFLKILNLKNKARVAIESRIYQDNKLAVFYEGIFAGFRQSK